MGRFVCFFILLSLVIAAPLAAYERSYPVIIPVLFDDVTGLPMDEFTQVTIEPSIDTGVGDSTITGQLFNITGPTMAMTLSGTMTVPAPGFEAQWADVINHRGIVWVGYGPTHGFTVDGSPLLTFSDSSTQWGTPFVSANAPGWPNAPAASFTGREYLTLQITDHPEGEKSDFDPPYIVFNQELPSTLPDGTTSYEITGWIDDMSGSDALLVTDSEGTFAPERNYFGDFTMTVKLVPGTNTLTFQVWDRAGNSATYQYQIEVQQGGGTGPQINITNPPAEPFYQNHYDLVITGNVEEGDNPVERLLIDGDEVEPYPPSNEFDYLMFLWEGENEIVLQAYEEGTGLLSEKRIHVFVDTMEPLVEIFSHYDGQVISGSSTITLQGFVDDENIDRVLVQGQEVPVDQNNEFSQEITLSPGANTIVVQAFDKAENSAEVILNLTLEGGGEAPEVAITTPLDGSFLSSPTVTCAGTATDVDGDLTEVVVNGVTATINGDQWSAQITISEGNDQQITAIARDAGGNENTATITISGDFTAPSGVQITSPANNTVTNAQTIQITGSFTSEDNPDKVFVNGVEGTIAGLTFQAELTLPEGQTALVATIRDKAGNEGTSDPITITIDRTPPQVAVDTPTDGTVTNQVQWNETLAGWFVRPDMPTPRVVLGVGEALDRIYAIGGRQDINALATNEEFDPSTDEWVEKAAMITGRLSLGLGVVDSKLYVSGGWDGTQELTVHEVYDPVTNTWETRADMPSPRAGHTVTNINGKLYAIGGSSGNTVYSYNDVYDPITDTWTSLTPMPTAREYSASIPYDGKIYVIGGRSSLFDFSSVVEIYDPLTDTWSTGTDMPTPRSTIAAGLVGNKIYVTGGFNAGINGGAALTLTEAYEPATDTWSAAPPMITSRFGHGATVVNDKLYAIGGLYMEGTTQTFRSSNEEFGIGAYELAVTGNFSDSQTVTLTINGIPATINGNTFTVNPVPCRKGRNVLVVEATDAAGNKTRIQSIVNIDFDAPQIIVTSPENGHFTNETNCTLAGQFIDENPATLTCNGSTGIVTDGTFTVNITLAEGPNQTTIIAADGANNTTTVQGPVINLDTVPPVVTVVEPTEGEVITEIDAPEAWVNKMPINAIRRGIAFAKLDDKFYAFGGYSSSLTRVYNCLTNTWITAQDMPTAREGAVAVVVDGKIHVLGGYVDNGELGVIVLDVHEVYDPFEDTWSTKSPLPTPLAYANGFASDGAIHILGGQSAGIEYHTVHYAYSPATDTWVEKAALPTARRRYAIAQFEGKYHCLGGEGVSGDLTAHDVYDPQTDSWQNKATLPSARAGLGAVSIFNRIYAMGGGVANEEYDPSTDTWRKMMDLPQARAGLTALTYKDGIYLLGGTVEEISNQMYHPDLINVSGTVSDDFSGVERVEVGGALATITGSTFTVRTLLIKGNQSTSAICWDKAGNSSEDTFSFIGDDEPPQLAFTFPLLNEITNKATYLDDVSVFAERAPLPEEAGYMAAAVIDGKIYVVGGRTHSTQVYDPATNSWSQLSPLPVMLTEHCAAAYDGKIYVFGGNAIGFGYSNIVYEFDPVSDTWIEKSTVSETIIGASAATIGDKIYVIGGLSPYTSPEKVREYSPSTDSWQTLNDLPTPRGLAAVVAWQGKLHVIGGAYQEWPMFVAYSAYEVYTPETDSWESRQGLNEPRHSAYAAVANDKLFVLGGMNSEFQDILYIDFYNEGLNYWMPKSSLQTAQRNGIAQGVNDRIYVIGGQMRFWPYDYLSLNTQYISGGWFLEATGTVSDAGPIDLTVSGVSASIVDNNFTVGIPVEIGPNTAIAKGSDGMSNVSTVSVDFIVDVEGPGISLTSPPTNHLTSAAQVNIAGTASDEHLDKVIINSEEVVHDNGLFSKTIDLIEGENSYSIEATDLASNSTIYEGTVTRDSQPPVLIVSTPAEGFVTSASLVICTGHVSDANLLDLKVENQVVTTQNGDFSTSVPIVEGSNVLNIVALDVLNQATIFERTVIRDTQEPEIVVSFPASGYTTSASSVTFSGTFSEANLSKITVGQTEAQINGSSFTCAVPLVEGSNVLTVKIEDLAGNSYSIDVTVVRATSAPEITISSPEDQHVTNLGQIQVSGTVIDEDLQSVTVAGVTAQVTGQTYVATVDLISGENLIIAVATDLENNVSQASITVHRDDVAPVINITSPEQRQYVKSQNIQVIGTVSDEHLLRVEVNGQVAQVAPDGTFAATIALTGNSRRIEAVAFDKAGNQSSDTVRVRIDDQKPTISITQPISHSLIIDPELTVSGRARDNQSGVASVTVNGHEATLDGRDYSVTFPVLDGELPIVAICTDVAGNQETAEIVVTVETPPRLENVATVRRVFDPSFNPYNPPEDAMGQLKFELTEKAHIFVSVFDLKLMIRYRSEVFQNVESGEHSYMWDGRDDQGRLLDEGGYKVRIELMDLDGMVHPGGTFNMDIRY